MANSSLQTDVVIIGGGGAGIPAAIEVDKIGGKAIVLEAAAECGGTAAISGGGCCIVGTPLQKSQGIKDTPDLAFEDWVKWGGGAADEIWESFTIPIVKRTSSAVKGKLSDHLIPFRRSKVQVSPF